MSELHEFGSRVEAHLKRAEDQVRAERADLASRMTLVEQSETEFKLVAERLLEKVIVPHIKKLASYFDHAEVHFPSETQCCCHFAHTHQFPATADVSFQFQHDDRFEQVSLEYCAQILPDLIQHERQCSKCFSLDDLEEQGLTDWVQTRLLAFVEAYLQVQVSEKFQTFNLVVDPVCKMHVSRSIAFPLEHRNHTYYFCAESCRDKFQESPERYVRPAPSLETEEEEGRI